MASAKIKSNFNFKTMKTILIPLILILFFIKSYNKSHLRQVHPKVTTLYFFLPHHFDTVDVKNRNPNITCIVLDKHDLKNFKADGAISFDIPRDPEFKRLHSNVVLDTLSNVLSDNSLSDSLILYKRDFFKRHIFYVIISKNDTNYFYRAKGEYMYKNFDNDVQYDSAKANAVLRRKG